MKIDKEVIFSISSFIMVIVGVILNIVATIREFGIWGILSKPSIEETKLLFANQSDLMIPGMLLAIVGYIILCILKYTR